MESWMAQTRNNTNTVRKTRNQTATRNAAGRTPYQYDSAARALELKRQLEAAPAKKPSYEVRRNQEKAHHMNFGYVLFLCAALCTCALVLVNYIQLQSSMTAKINEVSAKESELNSLKLSNDEEYTRITSNIDLEEIKRVAIGELGMTYASEGQIVLYENPDSDYMRKMGSDN